MIEPPVCTRDELIAAKNRAIEIFRTQRMQEPLEAYLSIFEEYQGVLEELLEATVDLSLLRKQAADLLSAQTTLDAIRFLTGPPISADDLKEVAEATLNGQRLRTDPEMVQRIINVVMEGLDRRRFPWISEQREPNPQEKDAAILATSAMIAASKLMTQRRNLLKAEQEQQVEDALVGVELVKVATRRVETMSQAPSAGEFCRESTLNGRKADFIVGLFDGRILAIECKVSNSATNSIKRLNNDAAVKAGVWISGFGVHVVPSAVLSGVYKLRNLEDAQNRALALFWAHDLGKLTDWIRSTTTQ